MAAISKAFCVFKKEILSWIGVTLGVCDSISQRNGVYDPIAVSRLRGRRPNWIIRNFLLRPLCLVNLIFKEATTDRKLQ